MDLNCNNSKKVLRNYLVVFLVCIFCSINLFGQKDFFQGYIIKNYCDTIFGFINSGGPVANAKHCLFKKDTDSEVVKYLPSELVGYRFANGKYYISHIISYQSNSERIEEIQQIETDRKKEVYNIKKILSDESSSNYDSLKQNEFIKKKVFLEFLINGRVDIYVYFNSYGDPLYFIKTGKDSLIELMNTKGVVYNQYNDDYFIEKKEYIGLLSYMLRDCEGIQPKITSTNLQNKSLIKMAKYYHDKTCNNTDEECIIYEKKNLKTHISIIPIFNYSNLRVTTSELTQAYEYNFNNMEKTSAGVLFNFSNFQYINNHLSTQIGISIQEQHFESEDKYTVMDFTVLNIPFGFKYSFSLNSNLQPFIGFTACPDIRLKKDIESNYPLKLSEFKKAPFAFSGQTGIDYHFKKNLFITINMQYEIGKSFYSMSFDESKSYELIIQAGLGFVINQN